MSLKGFATVADIFIQSLVPFCLLLCLVTAKDTLHVSPEDVHGPLDRVQLLHVPFVLDVVREGPESGSPSEFGKMPQEHGDCVASE